MIATIIAALVICFIAYRLLIGPYERPKSGYVQQAGRPADGRLEEAEIPRRNNRRRSTPEHILGIDYVDGNGAVTTRIIEVPKRERGGVGYLKAYCRLREEKRTFRLDRITRCVDIETGEIIEDIYKRLRKRRLI